ncbi:MAG: TauD/TfdA family dioxygenase [Alphaproteobacteria bacterium]|jgi:gamma-butyrobetaine dioxygenase|nr:TauD/TfdA family dioxygenase [Alphaproteobacteria bacterium]
MSIAATDTATAEPKAASAFDAPSVPMADCCPYETPHRLLSATPAPDDPQVMILRWSDGLEQTVHSLTLREHCPCRSCRHHESLERTFDQLSYPLDIAPRAVAITGRGDLRTEWPDDGHVSRFAAGWLRAGGRPEAMTPDRSKELWGRELDDKLRRFGHDEIMMDDGALLDWLETLAAVGLVYVADAPTVPGTLGRLIERVGFLRETNFGTIFDVEAMVGTVSNAYTSVELPLHVDLPTREYQPGYQFLHCLANDALGGGSVYGDGFQMAERLRAEAPDAFAILSTTPAQHRYQDEGCDYAFQKPLIVLDGAGAVAEVRLNTSLITGFDAPVRETRAVYAAYRQLVALTRDPANQVEVMMRAGEIACMDNRRVLHGRRAFEPGTGRRLLQGAYLEREEVESRTRTLRRRLPASEAATPA